MFNRICLYLGIFAKVLVLGFNLRYCLGLDVYKNSASVSFLVVVFFVCVLCLLLLISFFSISMYCIVKGFCRVKMFCLFMVMAVEGGMYRVFTSGIQRVRGFLMWSSCV